MKEGLNNLLTHIKPNQAVVVESAHIYADKQPSLEQKTGAFLAAEVLSCLNNSVIRTLLIDDYNVSEKTLNIDAYLAWLADHGYVPDEVVMESDLVPGAHELLREIRDVVPPKKLAIPKYDSWQRSGGLGLWTPVGKVPLLTSVGRPSCALLDASLYLKKSQQGQVCLTILPKEYLPQQEATLAILKRVNKVVPVVNLFFDSSKVNDYVVLHNK